MKKTEIVPLELDFHYLQFGTFKLFIKAELQYGSISNSKPP